MSGVSQLHTVGAAEARVDSAIRVLALLLTLKGKLVPPEQLAAEAGEHEEAWTPEALMALAKRHDLAPRLRRLRWADLGRQALPAIVETRDGRYVLLARIETGDKALIVDPAAGPHKSVSRGEFEALWSGGIILFGAPADKALGFSWFLPVLGKYRGLLAQTAAASILLQVFGLVLPLFTMIVMDKVLVTGGYSTLDVLVIGVICISVFEFVMGALRNHLLAFVSNRLDVELQARLFRHLAALPMAWFAASRPGATAARVQELATVRAFLTGPGVTAIIDMVAAVVMLAVMAYYTPTLTLIVVGVVALMLLLYGVVTPALKARLAKKTGQGADSQAFLVEAVGGIETVKSLALEPRLERTWEGHVASQTHSAFGADRLSQNTTLAATLLNRLMTAVTLWLGAQMVMKGELSAGQLMAFNMMAGRVIAPAQRLAQAWQQLQQARVAVGRLGHILSSQPEPARAAAAHLPEIQGAVAFEHVGFRYRDKAPEALSDVSFSVRAGERIGIVGSSGSGKSTIARLMQRLYAPSSGKILLDGVDIALADPGWLRRRVAVVLQENFLFNRSVRDNIAIAEPHMSMDRVIAAAKLAGAHEFILRLPEAYDTVVGDRGATLSGGQKQRLALARALATDPRVLILDEATSALDYESEHVIHRNMRRICAGRTVFVIAHRLAAVRRCDRILVVEDGRIVEHGSHDELLALSSSRYAQLHRYQAGDPALDIDEDEKEASDAPAE